MHDGQDSGRAANLPAMPSLVVGGTEFERVAIHVRGSAPSVDWERPYEDWIGADVELAVGGFRGAFSCMLFAADFRRFADELRAMQRGARNEAAFTTLEEQIGFELRVDARGHMAVTGEACDRDGIGNVLRWRLDLDQSFLPGMIRAAEAIAAPPAG
jgi:hypothetical protein